MSNVLGGQVFKNREKEIGWFPINLSESIKNNLLLENIPEKFIPFHWHGDTFSIPKNAIRIAENEICSNQGFFFNNKVFAFQFHLEITKENIQLLYKNCKEELLLGKYIQTTTLELIQVEKS